VLRPLLGLGALAGLAALAWALPAGAEPPRSKATASESPRILVFSRTEGFRHYSIPIGLAMIEDLGSKHGFEVEASEDAAAFTRANLARFDAVVFLSTTGDVLDRPEQRALNHYVRGGGGYAGIHSASDTEHEWPFYRKLVGAWFKSHPLQQLASFDNEAPRNPATKHLPERFTVFDEFYSFKTNPRPNVRVLLTIDESTYGPDPNTSYLPGGTPSSGVMGDHPMSWCHESLGGPSFYTELGHEGTTYLLGWFQRHVLGGIRIATGQAKANCSPRKRQ
jgi:type 1 glutamine amidotransferase